MLVHLKVGPAFIVRYDLYDDLCSAHVFHIAEILAPIIEQRLGLVESQLGSLEELLNGRVRIKARESFAVEVLDMLKRSLVACCAI